MGPIPPDKSCLCSCPMGALPWGHCPHNPRHGTPEKVSPRVLPMGALPWGPCPHNPRHGTPEKVLPMGALPWGHCPHNPRHGTPEKVSPRVLPESVTSSVFHFHWGYTNREIAKASLGESRRVWASLGESRRVWASLGKSMSSESQSPVLKLVYDIRATSTNSKERQWGPPRPP